MTYLRQVHRDESSWWYARVVDDRDGWTQQVCGGVGAKPVTSPAEPNRATARGWGRGLRPPAKRSIEQTCVQLHSHCYMLVALSSLSPLRRAVNWVGEPVAGSHHHFTRQHCYSLTPSSRSPRHRRAQALAQTHVDWPPQTVDTAVPALTHPKHACQCACQSRSASGATGGLRFTFSASDNDLLASAPPVASQGSISTYRYVKFKLTHA
jgi:hypothetical protein